MSHPLLCSRVVASLVAMMSTASVVAYAATPPSPPPTLAVSSVPAGTGIPYKWTVGISRRQRVDLILFVGAKSWNEPSNPDGLKGWTHTSNWIALDLKQDARIKVTVQRQQGVVQTDGTSALSRDRLFPAVSLYSGWDSTSDQDHTFNNSGAFWSTVQFLGNQPNAKSRDKIVLKAKLAAGQYTIDIGGNPPSLGDESNYPLNGCDPTDATCYVYTGLHGYHAVIEGEVIARLDRAMRIAVLGAALVPALATTARGQADPPRPPSLKTVSLPGPQNLSEFVRDRTAAIILGKALFWDMQLGSDGIQACASCHFNAGADSRSRNQLNPGGLRVHSDGTSDPDTVFDALLGANRQLVATDFPLSPRSNDVVSSQGVFSLAFLGLSGRPEDIVATVSDPDGFRVGAVNVRRVEPRNTPSVINAAFNFRNFWDGRAQNVFNGVNGLGDRDPNAFVYRADDPRHLVATRVRLEDSSLASQAVVPPVSATEMSADGRTMRDLGKKLLGQTRAVGRRPHKVRPLARQLVDPNDSVLGPFSRWPLPGLGIGTYQRLIKAAFQPAWWRSNVRLRVLPDGTTVLVRGHDRDVTSDQHTLMQYNFALFFGIAVQLYESTLVADDSPYDRFMDGQADAISPLAVAGVDLFRSQARGRCINCHENAELTGASVRRVRESPTRIRNGQAIDRGFNNISVLPTFEDLGVGGRDAFGTPLSTVRLLDPPPAEPIVVDGAFKVPGLRNVELTAPYFHNGGQLTLRDVLLFYSRGGDVVPQTSLDGLAEISPLNVLENTPDEIDAFEAFLLSLTDERVRHQRAPFDHPQLFVPDGQVGDEHAVDVDPGGGAVDRMTEIPAVGREGGAALPRFLE